MHITEFRDRLLADVELFVAAYLRMCAIRPDLYPLELPNYSDWDEQLSIFADHRDQWEQQESQELARLEELYGKGPCL